MTTPLVLSNIGCWKEIRDSALEIRDSALQDVVSLGLFGPDGGLQFCKVQQLKVFPNIFSFHKSEIFVEEQGFSTLQKNIRSRLSAGRFFVGRYYSKATVEGFKLGSSRKNFDRSLWLPCLPGNFPRYLLPNWWFI